MRDRTRRRGVALLDAIIGGVILSIGLGVALSVSSRALSSQSNGEKQMVAAWLAEELLALVVVEGPLGFPQMHDMSGRFEEPFDLYWYEVELDERGMGEPYLAAAVISWEGGRSNIRVETLVAVPQNEDSIESEIREPLEPLDRETRHLENDPDF